MPALLALSLAACSTVAPRVASREARSPSRRDLVKNILSENVRVIVYEGKEPSRAASGVVIASETNAQGSSSYVLTNAHAVDATGLQNARLEVVTDLAGGDSVEYMAEPVAMGSVPDLDLALVRVWGVALPSAQLASESDLIPGDSVIVAGAPFGRPISLSGGMVSRIELDPQTHRPAVLKTDAAIGYGASGGGIYSLDTGRLLAIVEGYRTAKVGFQVEQQTYSFDVPMPGETFAAPVGKVRAFLEAKGYQRFLNEPALPAQAALPRHHAVDTGAAVRE